MMALGWQWRRGVRWYEEEDAAFSSGKERDLGGDEEDRGADELQAVGIIQTLGKIWCPRKGISCKHLGENIFLLTFPNVSGERRALEDGPWAFSDNIFGRRD